MELYMTTDSGITLVKKEDAEAEIAELVKMLEKVNGTAMGFWRGNSVFSEIQELINKHKRRSDMGMSEIERWQEYVHIRDKHIEKLETYLSYFMATALVWTTKEGTPKTDDVSRYPVWQEANDLLSERHKRIGTLDKDGDIPRYAPETREENYQQIIESLQDILFKRDEEFAKLKSLTLTKAAEAVYACELYKSEYVGQDAPALWEWAVKKAKER